ncbi:unnamed protein product [Schistosoma turkestanicum]|nr:unnamed protein product [Schistosoma turkestanicum]
MNTAMMEILTTKRNNTRNQIFLGIDRSQIPSPTNVNMTNNTEETVHPAVITSLMVIIPFRSLHILCQLEAWSVALTWFFIFTTIGDSLPKFLPTNKKWPLTILTIACTLLVVGIFIAYYFDNMPAVITLDLIAIAVLTLLNMTVGQATLGKFRLTDGDACLASLLLYITLMLQQFTGYSNVSHFSKKIHNKCSTENNNEIVLFKLINQTFYHYHKEILLKL